MDGEGEFGPFLEVEGGLGSETIVRLLVARGRDADLSGVLVRRQAIEAGRCQPAIVPHLLQDPTVHGVEADRARAVLVKVNGAVTGIDGECRLVATTTTSNWETNNHSPACRFPPSPNCVSSLAIFAISPY